MEDELGQGSDVGVSEPPLSDNLPSETLVENNMGGENQVEETYEEGDDGEEIMVEIVGSDVFVDGVSGNEEGDFGPAEIGDMDGHILEKKEKEPETAVFSEAMDVSSDGGENKIGEGESGLSESRDEKSYDFMGDNKAGECGLGFPESKDEKNVVVTEAMDVCSGGCENKIGESELGLPESRDEKNDVVMEAMDVLSEGVENKMGENESGDENNYAVTEEIGGNFSEPVNVEAGIPSVLTEEAIVTTQMVISEERTIEDEAVIEKGGVTEKEEMSPLSDDASYQDRSDSDSVSSHGAAKDSHDGQFVTSEVSLNPNGESENAQVDRIDSATVTTQMAISEEKTIKDEADDGKASISEKEEAFPLSEDALNQDHSGSDSLTSHGATKEAHDGKFVPSEVVLNPNGDGQILPVQNEEATAKAHTHMVISEEDTIKDVVDEEGGIAEKDEILPLSDDALNQIVPSDIVINPNGEGPENIQVDGIGVVVEEVDLVNASAGGEILDIDTLKDGSFKADVEHASADGDCDKKDKFIDEKESSVVESEDLVVKSDVLASDVQSENEGCLNDSHGTKFESNHVNKIASERDEGISEEFDVVLDFKDGGSNRNPPDLSCVGNDESLKSDGDLDMNMVRQNHVVSNEPTQPADGSEIQVDIHENQPTQPEDVDGGGLSENVEKVVSRESKESLECQENAEIQNNVENLGLPQNEVQEVSVVITETSDHAVESITLMPSEVVNAVAVSDITQVSSFPEIAEKSEFPFDSNNVSLLDGSEKNKSGEEICDSDGNYHDGMEVDSELGNEQFSSEADKLNFSNEERVKKTASSLKMNQPDYFLPPENEGHFAISDLVWGKVRSHPWWPGQIFDPADASEKAVKYHKKDSYLIAYFGDRTFAWNDSSLLKPFRLHFFQIEKQSNSEGFQNAVISALEEVSRRVELGLACSCIPKDKYATIEAQIIENTGIREESSKRYGVDHSTRASCFEPEKLIEYVRELAPRASCGSDRLDLVIARVQLSSFYRFKGYHPPTIYPSPGELLEIDAEKISSDEIIASHKRKHAPKDSSESKKERSLTELMGNGEYDNNEDEPFGKKRKALDPSMGGYDKRVSIYAAKVSNLTSQTPNKPSFKIGECIRRVASQLTGSMSSGKDEMVNDEHPKRRSVFLSTESFSVNEMLLQLEAVAQEPKKRHNFLNVMHTFFMGFRSSIASNRRGLKKRAEQSTTCGPGEEFEFDDVSDSYWTDMIVHNYSEEQMLSNRVNGPRNFQLVPFDAEKLVKTVRKPNSRKRFSNQTAADGLDERVIRRKQESSPAELILNFAKRNSIPSEINLNKMFRRFGPLMESETEVDHESGCARVIFKRGCDAEVARDSSEKFNIFGPVLVNYQIGYEPLISVKVLALALPPHLEDAILMQ